MKLHKLKFVLPNLFTVTSIFCGFYALTLCSGDPSPAKLYQAALAIFFAMFFDGFDGRVARLTRTQSQFGVELDSLADVISFGVAPAMLVYKWALAPLGFIGLFVAFFYAACGALRLARFNVMSRRAVGSRFFVGLPIPLAAGVIVSVVIAHHLTRGRELGTSARVPYLVVVTVLSLLMVFDGVDVTGPIVIPTTGHWHRWRICNNLAEVKLTKGIHILTLKFVKEGNMNIDYLEFLPKAGG